MAVHRSCPVPGRLAAGLAVLAMVVVGCSSGSSRPSTAERSPSTAERSPSTVESSPSTGDSASTSPTGPASPATVRCGLPAAPSVAVSLRTADHLRLPAYETGHGARGVVLVQESGAQALCGWWPYAAHLATRGYHVLIFDLRCYGNAPCPSGDAAHRYTKDTAAAVAALRAHGARGVVLAGASLGGSVVLASAVHPPAGVSAVASLSGDLFDDSMDGGSPPLTNNTSAAKIRIPVLFALAQADPLVTVADATALVAKIGSPDKRLLVLPPQFGHGWGMVVGQTPGSWSSFDTTLQAFLAAHTS